MQKILSVTFLSLSFTVAFSISSWANATGSEQVFGKQLKSIIDDQVNLFEKAGGKNPEAVKKALHDVVGIYSKAIDKSIETIALGKHRRLLTEVIQEAVIDKIKGNQVILDIRADSRFILIQDLLHDLGDKVDEIQKKAMIGRGSLDVSQPIKLLSDQIEKHRQHYHRKNWAHNSSNDITLIDIQKLKWIVGRPVSFPTDLRGTIFEKDYKPWISLNEPSNSVFRGGSFFTKIQRNEVTGRVQHNGLMLYNPQPPSAHEDLWDYHQIRRKDIPFFNSNENIQPMSKRSDQPNLRIPRRSSQFLRKAGRVGIAATLLATGAGAGVVAERYFFSSAKKRKPVQEKTYGKRRSTAESSAGGGTSSVASGD